jgi:hypothetical protein
MGGQLFPLSKYFFFGVGIMWRFDGGYYLVLEDSIWFADD